MKTKGWDGVTIPDHEVITRRLQFRMKKDRAEDKRHKKEQKKVEKEEKKVAKEAKKEEKRLKKEEEKSKPKTRGRNATEKKKDAEEGKKKKRGRKPKKEMAKSLDEEMPKEKPAEIEETPASTCAEMPREIPAEIPKETPAEMFEEVNDAAEIAFDPNCDFQENVPDFAVKSRKMKRMKRIAAKANKDPCKVETNDAGSKDHKTCSMDCKDQKENEQKVEDEETRKTMEVYKGKKSKTAGSSRDKTKGSRKKESKSKGKETDIEEKKGSCRGKTGTQKRKNCGDDNGKKTAKKTDKKNGKQAVEKIDKKTSKSKGKATAAKASKTTEKKAASKPRQRKKADKKVWPVDDAVKKVMLDTLKVCKDTDCVHPNFKEPEDIHGIQFSPYWSRGTVGVKVLRKLIPNPKAQGKGYSQIAYLGSHSPCTYASYEVAKLFVARLYLGNYGHV